MKNPQPSQQKRQKIMGEDPQSLENHGFPQISQLVLHSTSPRTAYRSRRLFYKSRRSRILLRLLSKPDPLPLKLRFDFLLWTPQVLYHHSHHRTRRKRPPFAASFSNRLCLMRAIWNRNLNVDGDRQCHHPIYAQRETVLR